MMFFLRQTPKILIVGLFLSLLETFNPHQVRAQTNFWQDLPQASVSAKSALTLNKHRLVKLDIKGFKNFMKSVPIGQAMEAYRSQNQLLLPMPDGSWQNFRIVAHSILSPELAAKLPDVKTFAGVGVEDPSAGLRMDWTEHGFHAMIIHSSGTIYVEPYEPGNPHNVYAVFDKNEIQPDLNTHKAFICKLDEVLKNSNPSDKNENAQPDNSSKTAKASGTTLRTYRLAVAATGEFTQFHGGTVVSAQSAIVTIINRVNGIYNREVAIGFTLVDNSKIVFANASLDPFTNNDVGELISESQKVIDDSVGTLNYDIGHTFGTTGGGLAGLGVVCRTSLKARGVTGTETPTGDVFAVDYVAHEIGHQFGANHTFNSVSGGCDGNRASTAAYEPGSGTTIMAYAGLCDDDNIQFNSNDYFHTKSFDEIVSYSTTGQGNNCPTASSTGNTPPVVNPGISGRNIPIGTPFALTGSATDANGDNLTYCWEQFDLGPSGSPNSPLGTAPIFRSFPPTSSPTRTFPKLSDILNNVQTKGEILPTTSRTLTFRFTVRDNKTVSGVNNDQITLNVIGTAGPFLVTAPNTSLSWEAGTTQTITWDVAHTDQSPINCTQVNILLSTDGGQTFSTVLVSNTPNDGTQRVVIPNVPGTQNRIKIESVGNIFFDISNANFTITAPAQPTFSLLLTDESKAVCTPANIPIDISLSSFAGFTGSVTLSVSNLPTGANASFSKNNFVPTTDNVVLTIGNTAAISTGTYTIQVSAVSGAINKNQSINLEILNGIPVPVLSAPTNGLNNLDLRPNLDWEDALLVDSYEIQVSKDALFDQIVEISSNIQESSYRLLNPLDGGTTYFWRVKAFNLCGEGTFSSVFSFQTVDCQSGTIFNSTDIPKAISPFGTPAISSVLTIPQNYSINDLNVINLNINHTFIKDLSVKLISPSGTEVVLFDQICNNQANIRVNLDDEAAKTSFSCPPTDSAYYKPQGLLASFIGESTAGDWTLLINDVQDADGGSLLSWGLEICVTDPSNGNTSPFIITNDGLISFPKSGSHVIENTILLAGDNEDNATDIKYVLKSQPVLGSLRKNSTTLNVGAEFTQGDINNGLINYLPSSPNTNLEDSFIFYLEDSEGFQSFKDTFLINLDLANPIEEFLPDNGLSVYPNPSTGIFEIHMDFAVRGEFILKIYDLTGKLIQELPIQKLTEKQHYSLDLSGKASGVYFLEFVGEKGILKRRLLKVN